MLQMRSESDGVVLPLRQSDQCPDSEATKAGRVTTLGAVESKVKITFGTGGMHFAINRAIVCFLVNHETLRAGFDDGDVIFRCHGPNLDRDRRKIGSQRPNALCKILAAHKFGMLAGDKKDVTKSLASEILRVRKHFIEVQRDPEDRIIS